MRPMRKDLTELVQAEGRTRLKIEARLMLNRLLNDVIADFDEEYLAALNRGEMVEIQPDPAELKRRFTKALKALK